MSRSLPRLRLGLPGEIGVFARIAAYGLFIAAVYWLVAYEYAGTVLLAGFGIATGVVAAFLVWGRRRAGQGKLARSVEPSGPVELLVGGVAEPPAPPAGLQNEGPFGDQVVRVAGPSPAPFVVGLGLAGAFLGLVFGGWLIVAGGILILFGAWQWIAEVMREHRVMD